MILLSGLGRAHDQIQNVSVLTLENRSFDHLLSFSGITWIDAARGGATSVNGLQGAEQNTHNETP